MIGSDAVYHGRNADERTDYYKRCDRCKFLCKVDRDTAASEGSHIGWGITNTSYDVVHKTYDQADLNYESGSLDYDADIVYDKNNSTYDVGTSDDTHVNYDGIERTIYDPIQKGGCPNCGTYLY